LRTTGNIELEEESKECLKKSETYWEKGDGRKGKVLGMNMNPYYP